MAQTEKKLLHLSPSFVCLGYWSKKGPKTLKTEKMHLSFGESEDNDGACGLQHCKKGIFTKGLGSNSYILWTRISSFMTLLRFIPYIWRIVFTDKKENQIFLIYKEIQNGTVAKPYMTNGLSYG